MSGYTENLSMEVFYTETGIDPTREYLDGGFAYLDDSVYTNGETPAPVDIVDRDDNGDRKPKKDAYHWSYDPDTDRDSGMGDNR